MNGKKLFCALSWVAVIACMAVIFCLSAQKGGQSEALSDSVTTLFGLEFSSALVRKAAHCLEFMGLAALIFNAIYRSFGYFRPYLTFALTALYAASDEIHQLFVEGRSGQLSDVLIDCVGAAAGVLLLCAAVNAWSYIKGRRYS